MNEKLKLSVSPHIHSGNSTSRIMLDVLIALLPVTIAGVVIFGLRSLLVIAISVASCVLFEFLFCLITKRDLTIFDFSAAVTGLILALNLSAQTPIWQCVVGSLFAIILVKCLFGGIGSNVVNPAVAALVFMLVSFGSSMTSSETAPTLLEAFLGQAPGTIGGTCALALLIGMIYLLIRRVITWQLPVAVIVSVFGFAFFMEKCDALAALSVVLSGGVLLGAIFMATDYVTSPTTAMGKVIFGVGVGLITCLIRYFGIYSEGILFAILFMNILTPYIDVWTRRRIFGEKGAKA